MKKKFLVFDFDGTLFNTNEIIIESWQAAAMHYLGHELPREDIERTFGETLTHTVSYLMPEENNLEVCDFHKAYQEAHFDGIVSVFDGVREVLTELRKRGCKLAVATSRRRESFTEYMNNFSMFNYFDATIVMEDVSHHKPHPESLEVAMKKLGANPEETLMVGDTKFDMGCAKNAGVDSVMVRWSHYVDDDELDRLGFTPTYNIYKPEELLELI